MFADRNIQRSAVAELERIEASVRGKYCLAADQIVLVTEEAARLPGGPDRMTTILFWTGPEKRHRLRVYKPAADIGEADLPPDWLRSALLDEGEADCC